MIKGVMMRRLRARCLRLAAMFRRARLDRELADELYSHLEMQIRDNVASGMCPSEARRAAVIKLGQVESAKEEYRERRGISALDTSAQDLRYAARVLRKNPAFTMTAVFTLALGIGANSSIFAFVNGILLHPLPYRDSQRIVQLMGHDRAKGVDFDAVSFPNYRDWAERSSVFEQTAAYRYALLNLTGIDEPQTLLGLRASAELLPLLGIKPILGRTFVAEEDQPGRDHVVVLSYELWSSVFGRSRDAIGKSLMLDGERYSVVGVMPPDFNFPESVPINSMLPSRKMGYWVPLGIGAAAAHRDWGMVRVVGRLKTGATIAGARAEMETIARSLERQYPVENNGVGVHIETLRDHIVGDTRLALLVFLAAVSLVLLIACANVANLLAAHSTIRQRVIAAGSTTLLHVIVPGNVPRLAEVSFSGRLVAYTFGISLLSGLIFGLVPAIGSSSLDLSRSLKGDGGRWTAGAMSTRLRDALVIIEVALCAAVLIGAGLMFKSFLRLQHVDPGFQPDNVLTAWTTLNGTRYRRPTEVAAFYDSVLDRVNSLDGVEAAGTVDALPLTSIHPGGPFTIEGRPIDRELEAPFAYRCTVSPEYFQAIGIRLVSGRGFAETDRLGAPSVVMINESTAREYWPGEDPVGKRLSFSVGNAPPAWLYIVGVAGDVHQDGLDVPVKPTIYLPMLQAPNGFAFLVVRARVGPRGAQKYTEVSGLSAAIRGAVSGVDSDQPIFSVRKMYDIDADGRG